MPVFVPGQLLRGELDFPVPGVHLAVRVLRQREHQLLYFVRGGLLFAGDFVPARLWQRLLHGHLLMQGVRIPLPVVHHLTQMLLLRFRLLPLRHQLRH